MRTRVIVLEGHPYSEACAQRCIESGARFGVNVERFRAVSRDRAVDVMRHYGLEWTWANGNTSPAVCPITGLKQHPYGDLKAKIGCSMSHYLLWQDCDEPTLILEHDAVFLRRLPYVPFRSICQVNDPRGATPKGGWWSDRMAERGPGLFPKTRVFYDKRPDGLAGNSAYLLQPGAAADLVDAFHRLGVWPNDATMCIQLFPHLEELYPFVTQVQQTESTTCVKE